MVHIGNRKERFTGYCGWIDDEVVAGLFFLGRGERGNIQAHDMWQKASRGTVSSVE